ncbi:MAG: hypothetical protein A3F72_03605 [Bacteroidetes bacterium RIFCSPLOWO2_12_FULL_35_15]|nr:MAG: hypothetical protein A3F72_03605 [Bacteroidetes bacterium RIFCSPLOWO2_12_FULL_35_15]
MEENNNGSEPQTNGDDQTKVNTGSENNVPIENEADATPLSNSDVPVVEVAEVKAEEKISETASEGDDAVVTPESIVDADATKLSEDAKGETLTAAESVTSSLEKLPVRAIPLTSQVSDDSIEELYKDAVHLDNPNLDAVFEEIESSGRGGGARFVPNVDPNRVIKTYQPRKGEFIILPIGRNSDKPSEGGLIGSSPVEFGFGFKFFRAHHKQQVTLVLINGKSLIGYVLKGEGKGARRALYFPKHIAETVIDLPNRGKQFKLQVAKFLVG